MDYQENKGFNISTECIHEKTENTTVAVIWCYYSTMPLSLYRILKLFQKGIHTVSLCQEKHPRYKNIHMIFF